MNARVSARRSSRFGANAAAANAAATVPVGEKSGDPRSSAAFTSSAGASAAESAAVVFAARVGVFPFVVGAAERGGSFSSRAASDVPFVAAMEACFHAPFASTPLPPTLPRSRFDRAPRTTTTASDAGASEPAAARRAFVVAARGRFSSSSGSRRGSPHGNPSSSTLLGPSNSARSSAVVTFRRFNDGSSTHARHGVRVDVHPPFRREVHDARHDLQRVALPRRLPGRERVPEPEHQRGVDAVAVARVPGWFQIRGELKVTKQSLHVALQKASMVRGFPRVRRPGPSQKGRARTAAADAAVRGGYRARFRGGAGAVLRARRRRRIRFLRTLRLRRRRGVLRSASAATAAAARAAAAHAVLRDVVLRVTQPAQGVNRVFFERVQTVLVLHADVCQRVGAVVARRRRRDLLGTRGVRRRRPRRVLALGLSQPRDEIFRARVRRVRRGRGPRALRRRRSRRRQRRRVAVRIVRELRGMRSRRVRVGVRTRVFRVAVGL
eukprot:30919-Pelagococcus_subviridis.AAC.5